MQQSNDDNCEEQQSAAAATSMVMEHLQMSCEIMRCSMPSLSKVPTAARHFVSNVFGLFTSSTQESSSKSGQFSTPQANRKNKTNGTRRMSDSSKPPYANNTKKLYKGKIENWEPNVYEKELLRRTWSDEFDFLYDLGYSIYTYIFNHNPHCKDLFPFIKKYKGDEWKESKEFRAQALKFVQTISHVVKNIYHMDRTEPYLYHVGQRHCKFADRGFKPEYWDIFQDAMEYSLEQRMKVLGDISNDQKKDAVTVWRTLALYTTVQMRNGYMDGLKGVNKFPPLV